MEQSLVKIVQINGIFGYNPIPSPPAIPAKRFNCDLGSNSAISFLCATSIYIFTPKYYRKRLSLTTFECNSIQTKFLNKGKTIIFNGKEGFKALLEDILRENKNYNMIGYEALGTHLIEFYFIHWQKRRIKQKIKRFIIAKEKRKEEIEKERRLTEARYLPNNYEIPTSTLIYGGKAILFLPLEEDFVAVRIESKKIADSFNTYFEILWKIAKK